MLTTKIRHSFILIGFILTTLLSGNTYAIFHHGGDSDEGNGGDIIECTHAPHISPFSGLYSLDYVASYLGSNDNRDIKKIKSWKESAKRIANILKVNDELFNRFQEYISTLNNTVYFSLPRIWIEKPYGLLDLKDEALIEEIPNNCKDKHGRLNIYQVVRREHDSEQIRYYYDLALLHKLKQARPLQYSFVLIHEFLWDFFDDAKNVRLVNRLLHSKVIESYSKEELVRAFKRTGLVPVDYDGFSRRALNKKLLQDALVGNIEYVKKWIDLGADINTTDKQGYTPLMHALRGKAVNTAWYLIKKGAFLDIQSSESRITPLMYAAFAGSYGITRYLVEKGVRIHASNTSKATAITYAVRNHNTQIVKYLLDQGLSPNEIAPYSEPKELSIIEYAVLNELKGMVILLIDYKATLSDRIIDLALSTNNNEIIKILIKAGAKY